MSKSVFFHHHDSPVGTLLLLSNGDALIGLYTAKDGVARPAGPEAIPDVGPFRDVMSQLDAYFAGELSAFDLPLRFSGTRFQEAVWTALCTIEYGVTISYRELAIRIGNPRAMRAVGAANGQNPISIIVPCHRVVGANGDLVGYGGGLDRKRWLLGHERAAAPRGTHWKEDQGSWTARSAAVVR
ncbi:MAG: methylated-DNA--[protein]-cysteine S-methyltransferase [Polyangiaceae bacterium]